VLQVAREHAHEFHGAGALAGPARDRRQHVSKRKQQLPVQPPQLAAEVCAGNRVYAIAMAWAARRLSARMQRMHGRLAEAQPTKSSVALSCLTDHVSAQRGACSGSTSAHVVDRGSLFSRPEWAERSVPAHLLSRQAAPYTSASPPAAGCPAAPVWHDDLRESTAAQTSLPART